jgi:DNA-binding response OmpR family regulator
MQDNKKILIVEDEEAILNALYDKLTSKGYKVMQSFDGEDGLKVALEEKPDLILLDIIMPKVDGISMFKNLRNDEWGKTVPVIFLTNINWEQKVLDEINEPGPYHYLVKVSYSLEDILHKIEEVLGSEKK